jgi:hypothetical protein
MKLTLISAGVLLLVSGACAQNLKEADVPVAVKEAFAKRFSSVKNVKWSKENDREFEVDFKSAQGDQSANFDVNGKWLSTETEVSLKSLPALVQQTVKKNFAGYKAEETEKAETPDNGNFYEIKLEKGEKTIVAQITAGGKVLKTEEEKEKSRHKD